MSGIKEMFKGRRTKSTIIVPSTFNSLEEAKVSALYKDKERTLDRRIKARGRHALKYNVITKDENGNIIQRDEPSLGDEIYRHGFEESAAFGGKLGDAYPIDNKRYSAYMRLKTRLESLQAELGNNSPLVITMARMCRNAKDILLPYTVDSGVVDVERVVISSGPAQQFPDTQIMLPGEQQKQGRERQLEYVKEDFKNDEAVVNRRRKM